MKTIRIIALSLVTFGLVSCGSMAVSEFGRTYFSNDDIRIGDTKSMVINRYGRPYTQELELLDGKTIETLGYKESMHRGYKINTFFVFENGKLIKKIQNEEEPRPEIKFERPE